MGRGDSAFSVGFAVTGNPDVIPSIPVAEDLELPECCFELLLLVDNADATNAKRNDLTSWFDIFSSSIASAVFKIQKCDGTEFVDVHTITDNTYVGQFIDFGTETHDGLDYITVHDIDWTAIRVAFGVGKYRLISEATSILASTPLLINCDFEYNVQDYTDARANVTVYAKSFNSGNFADWENNGETKFTYPDNYNDGKRFRGTFGQDEDDMEEETTIYNDGFEEDTKKILKLKYKFIMDMYPQKVSRYIQFQMRTADYTEMTNYWNNNATIHDLIKVKATGGYAPAYIKQYSRMGVEIEFKHAFGGNFEKLHC